MPPTCKKSGTTGRSWNWTVRLKQLRGARDEINRGGDQDLESLLTKSQGYIQRWDEQVVTYMHQFVTREREEGQPLSDEEKLVILDTRAALRFSLCLLSFGVADFTEKVQNHMVLEHSCHTALCRLLSAARGDSKCRLFSAQILSNLVASNSKTSRHLTTSLPLSPSDKRVSESILGTLSGAGDDGGGIKHESNWVDMMISTAVSGNREAFAAIIAAMYNCVASLSKQEAVDSGGTITDAPFIETVSSNPMLVNSLLRQFVSVDSVKATLGANEEESYTDWDSATEWIYLLLTRLCQLGMLPTIYQAIATNSKLSMVTPEQIVLLHCVVKDIETFAVNSTKDAEVDNLLPVGEEAGWESVIATIGFLVNLMCELVEALTLESEVDDADLQMSRAGLVAVLDILAITLGIDSKSTGNLRKHLGSSTSLLQVSAKGLGRMVDDLTERSFGQKARDVKLSDEEQRHITSLVRVQGNLCFQCRQNQDLLRTTLVPPTKNSDSLSTNAGTNERNALHLLLTSTSFATSCFTLREWGVIAIRYALEDNPQNQEVVANLDAQDPAQSVALNEAGLRVQLDPRGKINLLTIGESNSSDQKDM